MSSTINIVNGVSPNNFNSTFSLPQVNTPIKKATSSVLSSRISTTETPSPKVSTPFKTDKTNPSTSQVSSLISDAKRNYIRDTDIVYAPVKPTMNSVPMIGSNKSVSGRFIDVTG